MANTQSKADKFGLAPFEVERIETWHLNAVSAYKALQWMHKRNEFGGRIPCPTGDPVTCPKCIVIEGLDEDIKSARASYPWLPKLRDGSI